jgi:hypothetical protein
MLAVTSVIIVLSLLFGGTGMAVIASQDSLPGETLYPIKIITEDIQFKFTNRESEKLEKALEFVNRRFIEASILEQEGKVWSQRELSNLEERLEQNFKDALLAAATMENPELGLTTIKDQVKILNVAIQKRPQDQVSHDRPDDDDDQPQLRTMFRKAYDIVLAGLEEPQNFKDMLVRRYGQSLEHLELLVISGEKDLLPISDSWMDDKQTLEQQIQAVQGSDSSPIQHGLDQNGTQVMPQTVGGEANSQNGVDENSGLGVGDPVGFGSHAQEKTSSNYQNQSDSTQYQRNKPLP